MGKKKNRYWKILRNFLLISPIILLFHVASISRIEMNDEEYYEALDADIFSVDGEIINLVESFSIIDRGEGPLYDGDLILLAKLKHEKKAIYYNPSSRGEMELYISTVLLNKLNNDSKFMLHHFSDTNGVGEVIGVDVDPIFQTVDDIFEIKKTVFLKGIMLIALFSFVIAGAVLVFSARDLSKSSGKHE